MRSVWLHFKNSGKTENDLNKDRIKFQSSYYRVSQRQKSKQLSNSVMLSTIFHNSDYLLLFEKWKLQSFEVS